MCMELSGIRLVSSMSKVSQPLYSAFTYVTVPFYVMAKQRVMCMCKSALDGLPVGKFVETNCVSYRDAGTL